MWAVRITAKIAGYLDLLQANGPRRAGLFLKTSGRARQAFRRHNHSKPRAEDTRKLVWIGASVSCLGTLGLVTSQGEVNEAEGQNATVTLLASPQLQARNGHLAKKTQSSTQAPVINMLRAKEAAEQTDLLPKVAATSPAAGKGAEEEGPEGAAAAAAAEEEAYYTQLLRAEQAENAYLISLAQALRERTEPPPQSFFRTVAVVAYEDLRGTRRHVVGVGAEAGCFIRNSVCAERAALAQLGATPHARVLRVVLLSDSPHWVLPGALCREYLAGTVPADVPVVVAGAGPVGEEEYFVSTVEELYPHPGLYMRLDRMEGVEFGRHLAGRLERPGALRGAAAIAASAGRERRAAQEAELYAAARLAVKRDEKCKLHPLSFGAAVLFDDGTIEVAWQQKASEYAASLDAVSLLAMPLQTKKLQGIRPKLLVQVDQFGVLHAPAAAGRALLAEHGFGHCRVLVHTSDGRLHVVRAADLLPQASDILGCEVPGEDGADHEGDSGGFEEWEVDEGSRALAAEDGKDRREVSFSEQTVAPHEFIAAGLCGQWDNDDDST